MLVTPNLDAELSPHELSTFPDFADWPATIAQTRFRFHFGATAVNIDGSTTVGPNRLDDRLALPESNVWEALFPDTVFVEGKPYRDLSSNAVLSFDSAKMDNLVRNLYSRLASSAQDELPTATAILGITIVERSGRCDCATG